MKYLIVYILSLSIVGFTFSQHHEIVNLTCDYRKSPSGVERTQPVLAWQIRSDEKEVLQKAYRIIVSDDRSLLNKNIGNIWDSKKVDSDESIQVKYNGKPLEAAKTYYWKVQVWTNKGRNAAWSSVSFWQMGLLTAADWKGAKWIAYNTMPDSLRIVPAEHGRGDARWANVKDTLPLLRKQIVLQKPVRKASLFICGLGHFEVTINGNKQGDHFLDPGWTQYDKEAQYVAFDVTAALRQGTNAVGIMLGNGFYYIPRQRYRKLTGAFGFPKAIARLRLEYADGSVEDIVTDESWKAAPSPITFSSIYGGEDYNASVEQPGWDKPGFNDAGWRPVVTVQGPPVLYAQLSPLKVQETFAPVKSTRITGSVYVYDLGQNASGIPKIMIKGKKGDTVRIVPGELLKEDGTVSQRATGSPVYFDYIIGSSNVETWQPRFCYYGFRYLQVERAATVDRSNPSNLPVLINIQGLHTRNAVERTGSFTSSSELLNQTYKLIDWSVKSNMASVLTDCPHREKLGWLEQTHLMGNSVRLTYDMSSFFRKTVRDMMAAQTPQDVVPEFAPEFVKMPFMDSIFMDSPEWGSASIILPWYLYQWYGDTETMRESYGMMQRYIEHLGRKSNNHILSYGLGDWYDVGPNKPGLAQMTPMGITATAIYYYDLVTMFLIAGKLGKVEDAKKYRDLSLEVRTAFNKTFFNPQTKQYGTGSQTANAIAVYFKLVDNEHEAAVIENIIKDIRSRNNNLTAGDVGYRYLLQVLDRAGRSDVIMDMNNRSDVPGYGYQLASGATALTESWQALPTVSNNHLMLGHLMEWFYTGLAGISQSEHPVAFKRIVIRPQLVAGVHAASASYASPYGLIRSEWKLQNGVFELKVEIPPNTSAFLQMPAGGCQAPVTIGSGKYTFTCRMITKGPLIQDKTR